MLLQEVKAEIDGAIEEAKAAPYPEAPELWNGIYQGGWSFWMEKRSAVDGLLLKPSNCGPASTRVGGPGVQFSGLQLLCR